MSARHQFSALGRRIIKLKDRDFVGARNEAIRTFHMYGSDEYRRSLITCLLYAFDSNCFYCGRPTSLIMGRPDSLSKDHVIPRHKLSEDDPRRRDQPLANNDQGIRRLENMDQKELQAMMINLVTSCKPCNHGSNGKRGLSAKKFFSQLAMRGDIDHAFIDHQCRVLGLKPPKNLDLSTTYPIGKFHP